MKTPSLFQLLVFAICLFNTYRFQSQSLELPKIAPLSPEVSNFARYSEVPVSYYTGIPSITIPLFTLNGKSISIPLSVSYHAGGIKVSDVSSSVGLGWNLNVGGQVTRIMNQLPDDFYPGRGYLTTERTCEAFEALTDDGIRNNWINAAIEANLTDFAPDEYHFSFLGFSGKFRFNQIRSSEQPFGEIVIYPESDIKVEPIFNSQSVIIEWKITSQSGDSFFFGQNNAVDRVNSTKSFSADYTSIPAEQIGSYNFSYITGWKLTKIITQKNEVITFSYSSHIFDQCTPIGESEIMNWSETYGRFSSQTTGSNSSLTQITSEAGNIYFNYEPQLRLDIGNAYALDNIELTNIFDEQIKKIDFVQNYFQSEIPAGQTFLYCQSPESNQQISKRLKLEQIKMYGKSMTASEDYSFEYNTVELPHRHSYSKDYWGYYNGASNSTLIPSIFYKDPSQPQTIDFFHEGADRRVNSNFTQANTLVKIKYPRGGTTEFTYENNRASRNFDYQNSINIFEPSFDRHAQLSSLNNNLTNVTFNGESKPAYIQNFTIEPLVGYQGRIIIESSSTIWDNTTDSDGTYDSGNTNLPVSGQDIRFCIKRINEYGEYNEIVGNQFGIPIGYDPIMYLEPGEYQLQLILYDISGGYTSPPLYEPSSEDIKITLSWQKQKFDFKTIGGLRIKSIKEYDSEFATDPSIVRTFDYRNPMSGDESGWIVNVPMFKEVVYVSWEDMNIPKTKISSNNLYPLITTQENYVGYTFVTESIVRNEDSIKKSFQFSFAPPSSTYFGAPLNYEWENGNLNIFTSYIQNPTGLSNDNLPLSNFFPINKKTTYFDYLLPYNEQNEARGLDIYQKAYNIYQLSQPKAIYEIKNGLLLNRISINEDIFYDQNFNSSHTLINSTEFSYGNPLLHLNPVSKVLTTSKTDEFLTEKIQYPLDIINPTPSTQAMIDSNIQYSPIHITTYLSNNTEDLFEVSKISNEFEISHDIIVPKKIESSKAGGESEVRIIYHEYDTCGNPLELSKADGTSIMYIWGYHDSVPIAKIVGNSYSDMPNDLEALISQAKTMSDSESNETEEQALRDQLELIRNHSYLSNSQVTTYTYDPLIGVTSITDPGGNTIYYEYDDFNRLEHAIDRDGNILSENDYNYRPQPQN